MMLFLRFLELQFPVGIKSKVARISTTGGNFKVNKGKKKRKTRARAYNKLRLEMRARGSSLAEVIALQLHIAAAEN